MAGNGWAKLGEALAGVSPARRAQIEQETQSRLAQRDQRVALAQQAVMKARDQEGLGRAFADLGIDNPDAVAVVARSGVNPALTTRALGDVQEQRFRQAAVDAAAGGDFGASNAQLMGVASGPVEVPKVSGGVLLANRLIPGGGAVTVTPVGAAQIAADDARGQAALIRAHRPAAARSGGSGSSTPRLSDVDKVALRSELADLKPEMDAALDAVALNQGATSGPGVRKLADAQAALARLQQRRDAIIRRYGGTGGAQPPEEAGVDIYGVAIPPGYTQEQFSALRDINLDRRARGQPYLNGAQAEQFRRTGAVSMAEPNVPANVPVVAGPAAAAPAAGLGRLAPAYDFVNGGFQGQSQAPAQARGAPASNDTPPMAGARKAKDGKWYIQRGGQYFRVD